MAYSNAVYGVFSQILDEIYEGQDKKREKANTWVVGVGTAVSALLGAGTYLLESDVEGLPTWLPIVIMLLGMIGTVFGVSRTKNGITKSTLQQINDEIANMIDAQEGPKTTPHIPEPAPPVTVGEGQAGGSTAAKDTGQIADDLDAIAKRIASNREG